MLAGFAKADISPPLGVELAGYGYYLKRQARGIRDPLFACALALKQGGEQLLLISLDALGANASLVQSIQEGLQEDGILPNQIILLSTHTHTGPCLKYHEACGEVDEHHVRTLPALVLKACRQALLKMSPVSSLTGICQPLGQRIAYNRSRADGPLDQMVRGFRFARAGGRDICVLSYACHPVCLGRSTYISADYPGEVCAALDRNGLDAMFLNGLCGDIDPLPCSPGLEESRLLAFAQAIVTTFLKGGDMLPISLKTGSIGAQLNLRSLSPEEIQAYLQATVKQTGDPNHPKVRVAKQWAQRFSELAALPKSEPVGLAYAMIGGTGLMALPFEGFTLTGQLVRDATDRQDTLVLGYMGELLGYLPTAQDIRQGGYAALESVFLYQRLPPQAGEAERLGKALAEWLNATIRTGVAHETI